MRRQRADQPARAFLPVAGFAGRVRAPQEARGATPATIGSLKSTFVNFSATVEFLVKVATLRHGLAGRVQTVASKGLRNVFALVPGQKQTHVEVVIEIVRPGFIKSDLHEIAFPKMPRLRRSVGP